MLEHAAYCPILHTGLAETKALLQLPAASKDRLFPILVARPWSNAKQLDRTWTKMAEAFGGRRFGLDLDRTRFGRSSDRPASEQFNALFLPAGGYRKYYDLVESLSPATPVIQIDDGQALELPDQLENIRRMDRGGILRITYGVLTSATDTIDQVVNSLPDLAVFVDAGWSDHILERELWASGLIGRLTQLRPEIEVVVSGSSFPASFSMIKARGAIEVQERFLHSNLARRHNAANLTYGDWGSTRPPAVDSSPMRTIPRIDLPRSNEWVAFRQVKDDLENYQEIAERVVEDVAWDDRVRIWGTYLIRSTANGLPGSIRSPASAAAARINIHLYNQANFDLPDLIIDGDEPFTDD